MPIISKRRVLGLAHQPGGVTEVALQRGFLEESLSIDVTGTLTLSVIGDVRAYSLPIKRVELVADNGKVLASVMAADLIKEQVIYEQNPAAAQYLAPLGTVAAHPFRVNLLLPFREPFSGQLGVLTTLPTFIYQNLTLRVTWSSVDEMVAGATGAFSNVVVEVAQYGTRGFSVPPQFSSVEQFGRSLGKALRTYDDVAWVGAQDRVTHELRRTADVRSLIISAFNAAGEPSDTVVQNLSLIANNVDAIVSEMGWGQLRADSARTFGVQMPTGVVVLDSAEDQDITDIFEATKWSAFDLRLKTSATGSVRVAYKAFEPGA